MKKSTCRHQAIIASMVTAAMVCCLFPASVFANDESGDSTATWTRLSGNISYSNGNEHIQQAGFVSGEDTEVDTVVLVADTAEAEGAAALGLAGARNAPVVFTGAKSLSAEASYQLGEYDPVYVLMVGFTNETGRKTVQAAVKQASSAIDSVNANLYASDAAATACKLYNSYGPDAFTNYFDNSTTAVIASAKEIGDIASIGAYAFAQDAPIFLTNDGSTLSSETVSALQKGAFAKVIIAGSTSCVSDDVMTAAANALPAATVERWGGEANSDVYADSAAIAAKALESGNLSINKIALASSGDAQSAIAGAAVCGANGAPLLISDPDETAFSESVGTVVEPNISSISQGYILGTRAHLTADFFERLNRVGVESTAADLHFASVSLSQDSFDYTGSAIKPTITVTDADGAAVAAKYYLVTYYNSATDALVSSPKDAGTYTVSVNGISGGYTNTRSATYTIVGKPVQTTTTKTIGKVTYTLNASSGATVKKVKTGAKGKLVIPASVKGYAVKAIAANAFKGCKKLTKVTFKSKKLTTVGKKAFFNCKKLKTFIFKSSKIKSVGTKAFKGTPAKCKVKVPKAKIKAYKKLFRKAGLAKKASVVKG